jgi:hypothetical protein
METVPNSYCPTNEEILGKPSNGVAYTYEDCYPVIDSAIMARRPRWLLNRLAWIDYDDVAQIIRSHIFVKFALWDQSRPLLRWVNRVITYQTTNIVRNSYTSFVRPCNNCAANEGGNLCRIYETQCNDCPLFAKWEKGKKNAHEINLAESYQELEPWHKNLAGDCPSKVYDKVDKLHEEILKRLTIVQQKVYRYLYIEHKSELEVAKLMGYRTSEKYRSPGYKQIEKFKKLFLLTAKDVMRETLDVTS